MKVFIKFSIQSVLVVNLEEEGRFICGITCEFVNKWRCEDVDQILLHGDSFFSVYSAEVMYQAKLLLFGVN